MSSHTSQAGSSSSNEYTEKHVEKHVETVKVQEKAPERPVPTRMQSIRITMKRALSNMSTFTNATMEADLQPTISHPLRGVSKKKLYQRVFELAQDYDLMDDLETLKKGARIAQKGVYWRDLADSGEITEKDCEVLERVEENPWRQITWPLLLTVAAASFGALTLGWDQGVVSGATLHYPREMGIDPDVAGPHQVYYNWLTGVVSAGPFLGAAGLAVWLSDIVNHYVGRKGCLYLAAVFLLACPLGSAFTNNWKQLFICRILLGFGIGFLEVTAPVFAAESAPQEIRGAMTINFQLFTAFGILLGASSNLIFEKIGKNNWRFMLGSPMVPVPLMVLLLLLCPESARWYLKWGKVKQAFQSLKRLRHSDLLAARDLYLIRTQMIEEQMAIGGSRNIKRFAQLFYKNRVRQSTVASCIAHLAQVLSGVNIVCLFSSTIFTELTQHFGGGGSTTALVGQHTHSNIRALWGSWGFGIVNFVLTFPALYTIDKLGRRTLMLLTLPNLFWTLLCAGLCFLISKTGNGAELGLVLTFIYLFTAFYSVGMGPIAFCYSAESAAQTHRELSVALAAFVNNGANAILSITFFRMRQVFTTVGVFGFYAGLNLVMLVFVFALVPETKQLSLEELDAVFAHSNREFMSYQFNKALPYYYKRYILQQKSESLVPLEELHHIEHL